MKARFATYAAIVALSAATSGAAYAASANNPVQDQSENQITAQLNQQQIQGNAGYGVVTYQGIMQSRSANGDMMQEQIAQPPADAGDLSIIE